MKTVLRRRYSFEASHRLPNVPKGHKCREWHGHSYKVEVVVGGDMKEREGWIVDFADVDRVFKPLIEQLDHSRLNDTLPNPTAELVAAWLAERSLCAGLVEVTVWETDRGGVTVYP